MRERLDALRGEVSGFALLGASLLFGAVFLFSEPRIGRVAVNDAVFHLAASERLAESVDRGEPLLDPWVSLWGLGYPLWSSYQPLPHLGAAAFLAAAGSSFPDPAAAFAALQYLLLVLLPASVYVGARLLGLSPVAAGLTSLLALAPSGAEELGGYGLGYGATTWRGSGLFTQLVALHVLLPALGLTARALDRGLARVGASGALAVTALCHVVFGYVAFASAGLIAVVGPKGRRSVRVLRLASVALPALVLIAWFVAPLALGLGEVNHSRWEPEWKWDSFGAPRILGALASGTLVDAGRAPILSVLLLLSLGVAILDRADPLARRLLALAALWLVLFLGRATWGHLLLLAGVPGHFPLHRLQAPFELFAMLLVAWSLARLVARLSAVAKPLGAAGGLVVAGLLVTLGVDRARYLEQGAEWGALNLAALDAERGDLEAALDEVRTILAETPGRASAGLAAQWGGAFRVGDAPVYSYLTRAGIDQASFLYHAMSTTSDVMVLRDEADPAHARAFAVRALVAPADRPLPYRLRAAHGRFAVYEASPEGYFGLVDVAGRYVGPRETFHEPGAAWLRSPLLRAGVVIALGGPPVDPYPDVARWEALPRVSPEHRSPCGRILDETKRGETYRATVQTARPCYALLKVTWHPGLAARVDGEAAPLLQVTPGFGAVPVTAGVHEVDVRYAPGPARPALLALGAVVLLVWTFRLSRRWIRGEARWAERLGALGERRATPRAVATGLLLVTALLALRPLFRGRLVAGHDAREYPPRLVEFAGAIGDLHVPPVWAPDLSAGYGQPLFGFAPPAVYAAALPFHLAGFRLADAIQLALALLHLAGAAAVYRLGRRASGTRPAALVGSTAWLFAPYVALDLFVRSAYAESAAVALAPVALLGVLRCVDRPGVRRLSWGGAAVALIPLAHNAAALLLIPALFLAVVASSLSRPNPVRRLVAGSGALVAGLGLSAFFWLPALLEKDLVQTHLLRSEFLHWSRHAVSPVQLLWSPWGHGLSGPGAGDGMSFALGLPHLALAAVGLVLAWRFHEGIGRAEAAVLAGVALAGAWLSTSASSPLWTRLDELQYLAYPWRALMLPGLCLPLLAVAAVRRAPPRVCWGAAALLIVVNLSHTEPSGYLTFDDEYYAPASIAERGINTTTREEYRPRWMEQRPPYTPLPLRGRERRVELLDAHRTTARQAYRVRALAETSVEAATAYYPGWTVRVDGTQVEVGPVPGRGTLSFPLGAGEHVVSLELRPSPLRRWSARLSAFLALALLAALLWARRHRALHGAIPPPD